MSTSDTQQQSYDNFMTVLEASELLRTSPKTLYTYLSNTGCRNGKPRKRLPKKVYRKIGRKVLFLREELIDWVKSGAEMDN